MKTFYFPPWVLALIVCVCSSGCSSVSGQLHDKAMEEQLLKPGALDVSVLSNYRTYSYKFLDRYRVTHDWIYASQCRYAKNYFKGANPNPDLAEGAVLPVTENGEHTWQRGGIFDHDPLININRYVRSEWQSTDGKGKVRTNKGFTPMCFESWGKTSHVLAIKLYKRDIATWKDELEIINPAGKFKEEVIGKNTWLVQRNEITERRVNTVGGAYLYYTTPIEDTGYTLTIQLGANQDSLKHPEAHARMQEIFRHLVESVKIEPLPAK